MDLVNEKNNLFLYFGDKEGKFHQRFHLFAEGHYYNPQTTFIQSNNPYISNHFDLKKNRIYFLQKERKPIIYNKAYKREKFLNWIHVHLTP